MTEIKAQLKHWRLSPRKVRLVADLIKGRPVGQVKHELEFLNKRAAGPLLKLVNSAVANAKNEWEVEEADLRIKNVLVNGGPILKRWRPRAQGRAAAIRKRTSHIALILTVSKGKKIVRKEKQPVDSAVAETSAEKKIVKKQKTAPRLESQNRAGSNQGLKSRLKKTFLRKVI